MGQLKLYQQEREKEKVDKIYTRRKQIKSLQDGLGES